MNLWVKRTVQLLGVALLFASCEDDSFLLGFKNQKSKFKGIYQEITLGTSEVIALDSIVTDGVSRILIGEYYDNALGAVRAESFVELFPLVTSVIATTSTLTAHYDSVTLELRLDFYNYGLATTSQEKFTIHRLTGDTLTYWTSGAEPTRSKRYFTNSTASYDPTPLGEAAFEVNYDTLKKNLALSSGRDTLYARARLDDAYGMELFNISLTNDGEKLSDISKFRYEFKGIAFVPSQSTAILGFNPGYTGLSKIRVHYHTEENAAVVDTLYRDFQFSGVAFHGITPNRMGDFATITTPYQGIELPSGQRAIQTGDALITQISLEPLYAFLDTLSADVIVNSASLSIDAVNTTDATEPISAFELRIMRDDYKSRNYYVEEDSSFMRNHFNYNSNGALFDDGIFYTLFGQYLVSSDFLGSSNIAVPLVYNGSDNRYSCYMARFVQSLINRRDLPAEKRIDNLGLYPATSSTGINLTWMGKTVDRTVFNNNDVKLRIYYTRPTTPTN